VQPRPIRRGQEAGLDRVALPMNVADDPALPERSASSQNLPASVSRDLRQNERPGPTDCRISGGIAAILSQTFLGAWRPGRRVVDQERARPSGSILGGAGGRGGVGHRPAQQSQRGEACRQDRSARSARRRGRRRPRERRDWRRARPDASVGGNPRASVSAVSKSLACSGHSPGTPDAVGRTQITS
jgi:hypothetical protein